MSVWRRNVYRLAIGETRGVWRCVLLLDVLEHLYRPERALEQIYKIMAENGRLIILFPNDPLWFVVRLLCGKWREAFADYGHVRRWTARAAKAALTAAGFEVLSVERIGLGLHTLIVGRKV